MPRRAGGPEAAGWMAAVPPPRFTLFSPAPRTMPRRRTEQDMSADFFAVAQTRLSWIGARQSVLAQNIANADTPGFRPRDLTPFAAVLAGQDVTPATTRPNHLTSRGLLAAYTRTPPRERAPDGNAVSIEDELTKVADDETNAALVDNLWKTYMNMYMTALGHGG